MGCNSHFNDQNFQDELIWAHVHLFPARICRFSIPVRFRDVELERAYVTRTLQQANEMASNRSWAFIALITLHCVLQLAGVGFPSHPMQGGHLPLVLACFVWVVILLALRCEVTEWRAIGIAIAASAASLFSSYSRSAVFIGADLELNLLYPWAEESRILSDSGTLLLMATILASFYQLPLRCSRSFLLVPVIPLIYLASTFPLPASKFEGRLAYRVLVAVQITLVALHVFAGRAFDEKQRRAEFLRYRTSKDVAHDHESGLEAKNESGHDSGELAQQTQSSSIDFSDAVFLEGIKPDTSALQLEALKCVGKGEYWLVPADHIRLPARATIALQEDASSPEAQTGFLGKGGFGAVFQGKYLLVDVAIKVSLSNQNVSLPSELRMLRRLRHPNIVAFYGACVLENAPALAIVEEYVNGKSLAYKLRHAEQQLETAKRYEIALGICSALVYLHMQSPAVVHGDLKPDNILLEQISLKPKLIDFGFCRLELPSARVPGSTAAWAAPEILRRSARHPTCAADMFSFGRVFFNLMTNCQPIPAGTKRKELIEFAERGATQLPWPDESTKSSCQEICYACLSPDPDERSTADRVLSMVFQRISFSLVRSASGSECDDAESCGVSTLEELYADLESASQPNSSKCVNTTRQARTALQTRSSL